MPGKLPIISGREAVEAFRRAGFVQRSGRGRGSHMTLVKTGHSRILTVPDHKELGRGTLRALIRDAGLTVDEFTNLLP